MTAAPRTLRLSPDLELPHEAVTQTFAILAMRGVGKTYTASVLAEEMAKASLPYAVLDPTGAWWGLRASADGKGEGYPVTILGGDHGDIPLEEGSGKLIADLLADEAPTLVLDLSLFSKSAMRRFVADFAEELYRKNRSPLHLIIDEADAFVPQKPRSDELRMLGAVDEIVRRGRIRGLGVTLVTQRSAVLNKDVLTQAEVLVALRTAHPRDRAPVLEWMKVHASDEQLRQVTETLATLPKGDAWVMSAGWLDLFRRVHIRERETFNSSATPVPGARSIEPKRLAGVDLERLQERMAATIERAKASDPRLLQKRVAELEAELGKARANPPPVKEKRVEVPAIKSADIGRLEKLAAQLDRVVGVAITLREAVGVIRDGLDAVVSSRLADAKGAQQVLVQAASVAPAAPPPETFLEVLARSHPERRIRSQLGKLDAAFATVGARSATKANGVDHGAAGNGALHLRRGERRILEVLARSHPARRTRAQLGTLSGFTPSGGTFGTYFGVLKRHGLLEEVGGGLVAITDAGFAAAGVAPGGRPSLDEILESWRAALRAGERAMLDALVDAYPTALTRDELGERAGFTVSGGTFGTYLGVLRRNGLADVVGDQVRAGEALFLSR